MLDSLVDLQLHVSGWIVPIPDNLGGGGGSTSAVKRSVGSTIGFHNHGEGHY